MARQVERALVHPARGQAGHEWAHAENGDGRLTDVERQSLQQCPIVTIPGKSFLLPNEHSTELAELIVKALAI